MKETLDVAIEKLKHAASTLLAGHRDAEHLETKERSIYGDVVNAMRFAEAARAKLGK